MDNQYLPLSIACAVITGVALANIVDGAANRPMDDLYNKVKECNHFVKKMSKELPGMSETRFFEMCMEKS